MRLGDLDRLYDCIEVMYSQSSGDEHKCERALLDEICEMPTIDAIPVEWLRKWPKDLRESAYVRDILTDWQKEQEAHGT